MRFATSVRSGSIQGVCDARIPIGVGRRLSRRAISWLRRGRVALAYGADRNHNSVTSSSADPNTSSTACTLARVTHWNGHCDGHDRATERRDDSDPGRPECGPNRDN